MFMGGFVLFALASAAGGFSASGGQLITARAVQGLAAAILSPAALSIVTTTFEEGAERNKALGVWGAVAAGGGAVGSLLGGVLTQGLGWEWVLWINTPIGLVAAALAPQLLLNTRAPRAGRGFDALGAVTITGGLAALVYALVEAGDNGFGAQRTLLLAAAAAVLLTAFVLIERRARNPLVPFTIFRSPTLAGATVTGVLTGGALIGLFFFATLYTQQVLGYGPLEAGVAYLPLALTIGGAATAASQLATRLGPKPVLIGGLSILAAGLYWFSHVSVGGSYLADILGPSLVCALGMGLAFVPLTIAAMSGVKADDSGLASGLMTTAQQVGSALGLAVLAAVATHTTGAAHTLTAMNSGFQHAFVGAAAISLLGALAASLLIRGAGDTRTAGEAVAA
jgi:EmrB/QacA subfamily drug resistance transporter